MDYICSSHQGDASVGEPLTPSPEKSAYRTCGIHQPYFQLTVWRYSVQVAEKHMVIYFFFRFALMFSTKHFGQKPT